MVTVVIEFFHVYESGCVPEVDEGLTVSPALYDNATWLRVERKQRAVDMTRSLHHATKPPCYSSSMMHFHPKQLEIVLIVELAGAVYIQVQVQDKYKYKYL